MLSSTLRSVTFLTSLPLVTASVACSAASDSTSTSSPNANSGGTNAYTSGGSGGTIGTSTGGAATSGGDTSSGGVSNIPSLCDRSGVLFCEDFEARTEGAFPGAPWTLTVIGEKGTIAIDATTPAKSGSKSAKVSSLGNYQTFMTLTGDPVFGAAPSALYVRTQIRLAEAMTGGHNTYFKAGASGSSSSNNETRVGVMLEMLMINQPDGDRGFLSNQNYWTDKLPGVVIPKEEWTCVEGFFDPAHSTVSIAVGGVDVPDLHVTDWKQDPLGALHFGFEQYAGPEAVLWYDDIVIGTEPIGCD